jgi:two-component system C4-dicarboxylate transport sensor histidine kinase DctB
VIDPRPLGEQLFGILFDRCSEAVFAVQRDTGALLTANRRFEELTGRTVEALTGQAADALFADDGDGGAARAILERSGLHEEIALRRLDGYPVFVTLTVAHLEHREQGALAACIARDTTERRLLERELLAKHVSLYAAHADLERAARSLAERNRELASASAQLSQAARRALIGELSAGIAHSLNNPLAALASAQRGIQAMIEEQGDAALAEAVRRYVTRGRDAVARMESIVRAVRRAHQSGLPSSPRALALADEVDVALSLFEERLGRIRVVRGWHGGEGAFAPPADLQQVLWNLLDNAILAMPEGGELRVEVAPGDPAVIAVCDSGAGVDATIEPTLFQPFNSTRPTGTGLGLATARRLARAWGGDVRLAPCPAGARFEILLPEKETPCAIAS